MQWSSVCLARLTSHGHAALAALCLPFHAISSRNSTPAGAFLLKGGPAEGGEKAVMQVLQLVKSSWHLIRCCVVAEIG